MNEDECDICHSDEEVAECRDQTLCINCRAGVVRLERDRYLSPLKYNLV